MDAFPVALDEHSLKGVFFFKVLNTYKLDMKKSRSTLITLLISTAIATKNLENLESSARNKSTETRKNMNLPYSIVHTYVLNEFLTPDRSCTTKYFITTSYKSW